MTAVIRFCPNDGTPREARFCAKCGFSFDQEAAVPPVEQVVEPVKPKISFEKSDRTGEPAGWYPDPLNSSRFRNWDGNQWGDDFSTTNPIAAEVKGNRKRVLLEGLAYGPDFVEGSSCYNCGNTLAGSPQCPLCGRDA